jgi:hypothetical protein
MDKINEREMVAHAKKLMNSIDRQLYGHPASVVTLVLCQCLAILMVDAKIPQSSVMELLEEMIKTLESDETAH